MRKRGLFLVPVFLASAAASALAQQSYLGFDRNDYPGDDTLPALRQTFRYTSYWLNTPPGDSHNSWTGKRALLKQQGFGFLVLFNGRLDAQLKGVNPAAAGASDGKAAVEAAGKEGFPASVLIFLDIEEGGRLYPEQHAYIFAWAEAVRKGGARAGVYCSGIDVPDGNATISTARDLIAQEEIQAKSSAKPSPRLIFWIANDRCPPAPGCAATSKPPSDGFSSRSNRTAVWQFAQSPRRAEFTASCKVTYAADDNCYAPGLPHSSGTFVDLNVADSPDPSE